jgi:hypothetical protein
MDKNQKKDALRIDLTDEQRKQVRETTGKDVGALEFTAEELEQRIAPRGVAVFDAL